MKSTNFKNFKTILSMLFVLMLVFVAACGGGTSSKDESGGNVNGGANQSEQSSAPEPTPSESNADETETVYPFTITDETGTEVTFDKAPTAIVTLVPSETEAIYAIGAGDLVVGVDEWSNYPEEAASKPKVGDMTTNIEAVAALNPDLVLASSSMNIEAVAQLRELHLNVFATDPKTYEAVVAKIEDIGKIVNKQAEAAAVAGHMREVEQQVTDAVKDAEKKPVYLEISPGWTVGAGEFLDELLTMAGGINIAAAKSGYFEVDAEEVVKQNPQFIIYPDYGEDENSVKAGFAARPGWSAVDAVKNNQIFAVAADPIVRVGPRLADGLLELAQVIHPELIKQ